MRRILVTGGAGLIGRAIVKALLGRGSYHVTVVDLQDASLSPELDRENFTFIQGDLRNYQLVDKIVSEVDGIIHLAAPGSFLMFQEKPRESTMSTVRIFLNILEAMKKYGKKKVVHASSSAVYGGNLAPYKESMTINPPDLKALAKKINEEMGWLYAKSCGITSIAMRPFSVYGEGEEVKDGYANVVSLFAWAMISGKRPVVWGDGTQTRDLIHVDDVAEIFVRAWEKHIPSQPLNVGTGIETSFDKIVAIINKHLRTNLEPVYVKVPIDVYDNRLLSDNAVLDKVIGYKPRIFAEEGIKRVVDYAKNVLKQIPDLGEKQMYFETLPKEPKA